MNPASLNPKQIQATAQAELERRRRLGILSSGVKAHTEYALRPVDWIVDKLGIPENTIRWSLNPEYQACHCPRCIAAGNEGKPHIWDGDVDPLVVALECIAKGTSVALSSGTGTGKAQPIDEPVLTPQGWRSIGDLKPGDFAYGRNGKPTEVLAVYPQGVRPVYRLTFSDGASTRACAEHLWVMQNKKDLNLGCPWRIMSTADLVVMAPRTLENRSLRVPSPQPIELPEADLPLAPYLLGVLLGDGGFRGGFAVVSTADDEILDAVRAELPSGVTVRHSSAYDYRLTGAQSGPLNANPLTAILRNLGLWGHKSETKFIPPVYLTASAPQRLALLCGLLDTDGSVSTKGKHIEYCSTSNLLADGVVELVRSLGGTARCQQSASYLNGTRHLDRYRISVNMPEGIVPFRLERKAAIVREWGARSYGLPSRILRSVEPAGEAECVCIRVASDDSLYVTKDYIVTHNTFALGACGTLWFLATHDRSIALSIAPQAAQLLLNQWKEIGNLFMRFKRHFPSANLLTGKLRVLENEGEQEVWAATAFAGGVGANEDIAQRLAGFHQPCMLWSLEDAPGIDIARLNTVINTAVGSFNPICCYGNPDHKQDALGVFGAKSWVTVIRASAFDHPNIVTGRDIVPGGVSPRSLAQRLADADGNPDDPIFLSRVRGIAPTQSKRALIRWEWLEAAAQRWGDVELRKGPLALGIDVADSPAGDKSAFSRWSGGVCTEIESFSAGDASEVGRKAYNEITDSNAPIDPRHVGIDSVGVGASTVNELRRLGVRIRALSGGTRAVPSMDTEARRDTAEGEEPGFLSVPEAGRWANLRSQIYWRLREDLRLGRIGLPKDTKLFEALTAIEYEEPGGKVTLASKDQTKARIGRSPDDADSVAYGNWVRARSPQRAPKARDVEELREPNRDTGLERVLARRAKQQAVEQRKMNRRFRRRTP